MHQTLFLNFIPGTILPSKHAKYIVMMGFITLCE